MSFVNTALPILIERAIFRTSTLENKVLLNPMPLSLVALSATVVSNVSCFMVYAYPFQLRNALEEWSTGIYVSKPLKEEFYAATYRKYCKKLNDLQLNRSIRKTSQGS